MIRVASPPSSTTSCGPLPALPGEYGYARLGDGGGGVVLGREDIARAPADVGAEVPQGLDQHRGLDRHVQAAHHADTLQRFLSAVLFAGRHQPRHLLLGDGDLAPAPFGEADIFHLVVGGCGRGHESSFLERIDRNARGPSPSADSRRPILSQHRHMR
jgi:hypothetical protein